MAGRVNRARLSTSKTAFTLSTEPLSEQVPRKKAQNSEKPDNSHTFSACNAIRQQSHQAEEV